MMNLIGQEIGAYKLQLLLGSGSSAHVYLGENRHNRTYVAVKILNTPAIDEWIERWNNETHVLSYISHPHIIRMLEFGIHDNIPFRITNWAEWGTFLDLFAQSVPIREVATYVKQVASALQYLHSKHIIHRDVKPTNILVEQNGKILLTDFEFAVDYRNCQSAKGPPTYAAPEQKQGQPCPASDQYALGVIVYQWLCGELPFHGSSADIGVQQRETSIAFLKDKFPTLPHAVGQVLLTALAKDPGSRFTSIQMFAKALEQACRSSSYYTPSQKAEDCQTE
jgi:serine/threonine protein kinase